MTGGGVVADGAVSGTSGGSCVSGMGVVEWLVSIEMKLLPSMLFLSSSAGRDRGGLSGSSASSWIELYGRVRE